MAEVVDEAQHDFWRAPMLASSAAATPQRSSACRCGTEFIVGSLFCHACGASRPDLDVAPRIEIRGLREITALIEPLGLTTPALIAFIAGLFCVAGTLAVSVFF